MANSHILKSQPVCSDMILPHFYHHSNQFIHLSTVLAILKYCFYLMFTRAVRSNSVKTSHNLDRAVMKFDPSPINMATLSMQPNFHGPLVTILTFFCKVRTIRTQYTCVNLFVLQSLGVFLNSLL